MSSGAFLSLGVLVLLKISEYVVFATRTPNDGGLYREDGSIDGIKLNKENKY